MLILKQGNVDFQLLNNQLLFHIPNHDSTLKRNQIENSINFEENIDSKKKPPMAVFFILQMTN